MHLQLRQKSRLWSGIARCRRARFMAILPLFLVLLLIPSTLTVQAQAPATSAPQKGEATAPPTTDETKEASASSKPATAHSTSTGANTTSPPRAKSPTPSPRPQAPAPEPGQLFLELTYAVDGTDIQGNRDRSFLNSGINHTAEVSFFNDRPVLGNKRLELLAVGRYTDNPRVDPERNSLQRAYAKLMGKTFEVVLGDNLANYSRLTLNQNIKGFHAAKELHPRFKMFGTVGYFTDRWGSLYRDYLAFRDVRLDCTTSVPGFPAAGCIESPPGSGIFLPSPENPGKPYSRLSGGARAEWKMGKDGWIAANWSHGKDLLQSLPEARILCEDTSSGFRTVRLISPGCLVGEMLLPRANRPSREAFNNDVLGVDVNLEVPIWQLRFRGEVVNSWTSGGQPPPGADPTNFYCASQPPIVGASVLDERCFRGQVADWAVRAEVTQKIHNLSWRADYVRFEPDFYSANARQIRDLEDFLLRGDYRFARQFLLAAGWRRSTDNLNGMRHYTNLVQAPEVRAVFREMPYVRGLTLQVGYRERTIKTVGAPTATEERDRTTHIPFFSADWIFGPAQLTFDYERRHDADRVRPSLASDTDSFAFGIRSNHNWGGWVWRPFFRLELERLRKNQPNSPGFSPTDPTLLFPFDFFDAFDTGRSIQAGFSLEAPSHVRFEGQYREFNSILLTSLQASTALDPARNFFYLNQGFKRPSWRAMLTYKIKNDENRLLNVYYARQNNFFATGDPFVADLKSFRETIIGGSVVLRFGH